MLKINIEIIHRTSLVVHEVIILPNITISKFLCIQKIVLKYRISIFQAFIAPWISLVVDFHIQFTTFFAISVTYFHIHAPPYTILFDINMKEYFYMKNIIQPNSVSFTLSYTTFANIVYNKIHFLLFA